MEFALLGLRLVIGMTVAAGVPGGLGADRLAERVKQTAATE
jgi:hypothetical protein